MRAFANSPKTSAGISMGGPWPRERGRRSSRLRKYVRRHRAALLAISPIGVLLSCNGGACPLEPNRPARPAGVPHPGGLAVSTARTRRRRRISWIGNDRHTDHSTQRPSANRGSSDHRDSGVSVEADRCRCCREEIQVEAVLDARFQRVGDRLRLTAQLISVTSGTPLWAETFDAQFTNVFAVQDSISQRVAETLLKPCHGGGTGAAVPPGRPRVPGRTSSISEAAISGTNEPTKD